ncbi:FhaA domain-containing protein [Streptomyces luteolus]|uniref:DUF3662 domain-containing protein n=1 Tax=Streptomyces luteolus TaxID=3043615 RepID=A0ABT6SUP1_9ACTN|nr:FhaA domain-containing protein [Streptomyces sp. B-S-A12]MDI3419120.1 DUF3662 domain-containing protein [Streptomyces sp. B-S-A12]
MRLVSAVEHTMERWSDSLWAFLLPPRRKECEVVAILFRQCDDNALILNRERTLVPNDFVIEFPPPIHSRLTEGNSNLDRQLSVQVRRHAAEAGYSFAGPVTVHLTSSGSSAVRRFRIHSRIVPSDLRHRNR